MDYKEYSKLRSIARKRIERAAAAGLAPYVFIPTVKEVKASGNPEQYMSAVKDFLKSESTVRNIKKAPETKFKVLDLPAIPPGQKKEPPLSPEAKKARRREQNRRSKAKRAVEKAAASEGEARKRVGYLKALETVAKQWREAGVDVGNYLGVLSPGRAKAFTEYMEYRFSQGDYNSKYVIDTFIRDFGELVKRNYNFENIKADFGAFLDKQKELKKGKRNTNRYGISEDEVYNAWSKFAKG